MVLVGSQSRVVSGVNAVLTLNNNIYALATDFRVEWGNELLEEYITGTDLPVPTTETFRGEGTMTVMFSTENTSAKEQFASLLNPTLGELVGLNLQWQGRDTSGSNVTYNCIVYPRKTKWHVQGPKGVKADISFVFFDEPSTTSSSGSGLPKALISARATYALGAAVVSTPQVGIQVSAVTVPPIHNITTGLLIPLYMYPIGAPESTDPSNGKLWWQEVIDAKNLNPGAEVTIISNPSNGHFGSTDPNYAFEMALIQAANIKILGYVFTLSGTRPIADVKADIDAWVQFYPNQINGIFFDQFAQVAGSESYYSQLTQYVKFNKGLSTTIGNPGADTSPTYVGTVDTIVIYEHNSMPTIAYLNGGWHTGLPASNFGYIANGITSLDSTAELATSQYVKYLYINRDGDPPLSNPYKTVPHYLADEMAVVA